MIIKFICINGHRVEIEESELSEVEGNYCWCGEPLRVENLDEIVAYDVEERAEKHLNNWVAERGWDNVIDMIKKCKLPKVKEIYIRILQRKGFKIND